MALQCRNRPSDGIVGLLGHADILAKGLQRILRLRDGEAGDRRVRIEHVGFMVATLVVTSVCSLLDRIWMSCLPSALHCSFGPR